MGYKAAVQILKQAEDLKSKVLRKCDLLIDSQAWTDQQKLQSIYHQALVLDLEYALDKKVEQDLWNVGFKNHISILQELARDKKNSRRSESQALLTWCLEAASGFYLTLLQELCNAFDVDLPFRRRGNVYGQSSSELNSPQTSSCLYICQYCLVHLGDIARYRNQRKQAENFYKQAILVSPTSGHPYNQLGLLEASQGDKLSTVFYYIRGIAVKNPFPASTTNLLSTLSSTVDKESPLEKVQTKLTASEFIQIFLCTHALLHTATDLAQADLCVRSLNTTMTALVATQSFTADKLVKITAINLYALRHVAPTNSDELTEDERAVRGHVLDLLAGSLSAFLVPVHTLKNDESLLDYYALPAVKILTYWIRSEPEVLKEVVFTNRLQIWPSLCKLLNNVSPYLKEFDCAKYSNCPLSEDKTLQGFRPLQRSFKELDFKTDLEDRAAEKLARARRIVDFGLFLTELDVNNAKLIIRREDGDEVGFEPGCIQPDPTNDLLEEMKSFNVADVSPNSNKRSAERRGGILKPQGSLEKSREEREQLSSGDSDPASAGSLGSAAAGKRDAAKPKRSKQNVALQSIFKKLEENKQVKFNVEDKDKEKALPFEAPISAKAAPAPFNLPLRTQSFNQNHPAFPAPPPPQPDYLSALRNVAKPGPPFGKSDAKMAPYQPAFGPSGYGPGLYAPRSAPPYQFGGHAYAPKPDEAASPWWPPAGQPSYQQHGGYAYGGGGGAPYLPPGDYGKPQSNQAAGDMFSLPWNHLGRSSFDGYDGGSHGVSVRQAMLKEAGGAPSSRPMNAGAPRAPSDAARPQFQDGFGQGAGYSLFNANSWTPNLVGQLRSSKAPEGPMAHLPQHSLFTGQGPQSLAQLLEQQQSQKSDL